MATIYAVANQAGVSTATVSRVLSGDTHTSEPTRAKVRQAVEQLNYLPMSAARSLAVQRHEAQGLVVPDLTGPYYSELLMGYESSAASRGQSVLLVVTHQRADPLQAVRMLASRVDGLVVSQSTIPDQTITALSKSLPIVLLARDPIVGCDLVRADGRRSAASLTAHLLAHGRRRLLFIGDPDSSPDVRDRYRGFLTAHQEVAVSPWADAVRVPLEESHGAPVAERLVAEPRPPDAVVCGNDELALALMQRLQQLGLRVPDDVAVTGWDDTLAARYVTPGLTTIRQPVRRLGEIAAELLYRRVTERAPSGEPHILSSQLVLRASCGCAESEAGADVRTEAPTDSGNTSTLT